MLGRHIHDDYAAPAVIAVGGEHDELGVAVPNVDQEIDQMVRIGAHCVQQASVAPFVGHHGVMRDWFDDRAQG